MSKVLLAAGALLGAATFMGDSAQADPSANFYPGDKLVRLRALAVAPDINTSDWTVNGGHASGLDADVFATVIPELDLTYFLTSHLAVEVIAGVVPVSIKGKGDLTNETIGDTWLLPPTVTLQYHLGDVGGINPYVGAGVNYTAFFNNHAGSLGGDLKIDGAWGAALQAGFDMPLGNNLFLNVDVKKIFLNTDVKLNNCTGCGATAPDVKTNVDIDPWIVGVGVGYRLGGNRAPLK